MSESLLDQAQKALALSDVYMKKASATVKKGFNPKYDATELGIQLKIQPHPNADTMEVDTNSPNEKARILVFQIDTGIRYIRAISGMTDGDISDEFILGEIEATWVVEYQIKDESKLNAECVSEFANKNVSYHVWPYWREFIHSSSTRFRLPQVVLPMHRLLTIVEPSKSEAAGEFGK